MSDSELWPPVDATDHAAGPDNARLTLVEYGDFQCPYCGMAYPILERIRRRMGGDLRFVFRHFPLNQIHAEAQHAAESAEAAAAQGKFWEMHDKLFENQHALDDANLLRYAGEIRIDASAVARDLADGTFTKRVRDQFRSGVRSGVNGTPTFFVNGRRYDGTWADEKRFREALEGIARSAPLVTSEER